MQRHKSWLDLKWSAVTYGNMDEAVNQLNTGPKPPNPGLMKRLHTAATCFDSSLSQISRRHTGKMSSSNAVRQTWNEWATSYICTHPWGHIHWYFISSKYYCRRVSRLTSLISYSLLIVDFATLRCSSGAVKGWNICHNNILRKEACISSFLGKKSFQKTIQRNAFDFQSMYKPCVYRLMSAALPDHHHQLHWVLQVVMLTVFHTITAITMFRWNIL